LTSIKIIGGEPLSGTVEASGSKNATLPIMAASILASEPVCLEGVPRLDDVDTLILLLNDLGVHVTSTVGGGLVLDTVDVKPVRADYELVRRMRASFCVLGPLLARRGRAIVSLPGGCNIGDRPVDLHLAGLAALGADFRIEHGYVVAKARRLVGTSIDMLGDRGTTVTGTANVLSAAVLARGVTTITNAAMEPEIVDLGNFLSALGARIEGLGTSTLRIEGVAQLGGAIHRVIPDRIEVATLLMAAAITGGCLTVENAVPAHLFQTLSKLQQIGATVSTDSNSVTLHGDGVLRATEITACPYPGIPTDIQAQWAALLSFGEGTSMICDRVFPNRFMHVAELSRLGANIQRRNGSVSVAGVRRLTGATVTATDLRASAALVMAGLVADGETVVLEAGHLDRGYERLDEKVVRLGANVQRI